MTHWVGPRVRVRSCVPGGGRSGLSYSHTRLRLGGGSVLRLRQESL